MDFLIGFIGVCALVLAPIFLIIAIVSIAKKRTAKKWFIFMSISLALFVFCVFTPICAHEWIPATCSAPQTCSECGKTKGTTLEHKWKKATCTEPKTCEVCELTEGEEIGHNWQGGSCTEPRICSVCLIKDEESIGHKWLEATYEKPKTCSACGATQGSPLINYKGTTKNVVEGYKSALEYAIKKGYEVDYAYNDTRTRLVKINSAAYMNDVTEAQWAAWQIIPGDVDSMSCAQLQKKAQAALEFIVPDSSDRLSALMKKFKKMSSVTGTIKTTEINIVVKDMDKFVKEMGLTDKIVGGVLAILNSYDYSWLDDNADSAVQFTENGFTFKWRAVGNYKLSLD